MKTFSLPVLSFCLALAAIIAGACVAADSAEKGAPVFRAGAFAMDITPLTFPVDSSGSMTRRSAESAHDPLHARCIVLDDGKTKLAIAVCDSCMIPREIFDAAKQRASKATGIPVENMLFSATHTHTAVTAGWTFRSVPEESYLPFLTERIAEGIIVANERLEPARIGWAVGNNPNQVFNRRWHMRDGFSLTNPFEDGKDKVRMNPLAGNSKLLKPSGPVDPEIPVVSIQSADGKTPIALLANYSLHYVGGVPSKQLSADYFGEFARKFSELIGAGPEFVGIMSNGTSGNINNVNFFSLRKREQPFEQIRLVAADVANSAKIALDRIEYHDWVPLKAVETEIELGVRKGDAAGMARAKKLVAEAGTEPTRDRKVIYAFETLDLAKYPDTVQAKLQAMRIGGLGIVSSPCETFVETGLAIKQESPLGVTFTIELANGYNGYLPTPEHHALGGYETWRAKSSYLAVDAEPKVRATMLQLLDEVASE